MKYYKEKKIERKETKRKTNDKEMKYYKEKKINSTLAKIKKINYPVSYTQN
jgi:hypothetical protein